MKKITLWFSILLSWVVFNNTTAQVEDFESTQVGQVPTGWVKYQSASDDNGFAVSDQAGVAQSGTHFLAHMGDDISAESTSWVVSNAFTPGNAYELSFYWRGKWSFAYNFSAAYISVGSNDPVANPNDFVLLDEFSPANYSTWLQWNFQQYDLSQYQGQTVYLAFKYVGDHAHDFYVDDVSVAPMPYCDLPSNVVAEKDINDFHVLNVTWTPVAGQSNYEVAWGAPGFDPNASGVSSQTVSGNSYTITGLQESTPYDVYVRTMCSSYNHSPWEGPFTATTAGPPPVNNDCSGAINLDVYAIGASVGNETFGDTTNATDSGNHTSCDNTGVNLDLWYTFTVPAGETKVKIIGGGAHGSDIGAALYDACGGTELNCKSPADGKTLSGLTPGTTYTLQVWLDDLNTGSFNIALELLPPVPPNNDCSGAINLDVYAVGASAGHETAGDTTSATDSGNHPTCDDYGTNLDLWYTFTMPAGETKVKIIGGGAHGSDIEAALYDACGGTELNCKSPASGQNFGGLTPGTTYTIQVWLDDFNSGAFTVALELLPPGPGNDNCAGAIPLTLGAGSCTNPEVADNSSATDSGVASPGCGSYSGGDLWYSITVPTSGTVTIETSDAGGITDTGLAVYSGSCGSLREIECNDDIGYPNYFSRIELTGQTAGDIIYARVWEYGNNNFGDFGICAYDPTQSSIADNEIAGLKYYPNPTNNILNVEVENSIDNIEIYGLSGNKLLSVQPNTNHAKVDLHHLKQGVYFVKLYADNQVTAFKIIKK